MLGFLGSDRKTGPHPGTVLVVYDDAAGQRTTVTCPPWTPWAPPTPPGRLGWWGMCSRPADSSMNLSWICRIGFDSPRRTGGRSHRISIQGEGYKTYSGTSPPGGTPYQGWSASPCWGLTWTEQFTSCTRSSLSWSAPIILIGNYLLSVERYPWRTFLW